MAQLDTLKKKNKTKTKKQKFRKSKKRDQEKKRGCLEFVILKQNPPPPHTKLHVSTFTLLQPPKLFPSSSIPCP